LPTTSVELFRDFLPTSQICKSFFQSALAFSLAKGSIGYRDRVPLRAKEAAKKMLGVSNSGMYEIIGKLQIGMLSLGDRCSIRIPKKEVVRLLSEDLVPAQRV
jgi:hypothetical protein